MNTAHSDAYGLKNSSSWSVKVQYCPLGGSYDPRSIAKFDLGVNESDRQAIVKSEYLIRPSPADDLTTSV